MADRSIPQVGTRVSVTLFAGDLLAHQHLVLIESYESSGYVSARFRDGAGADVAVTGDRSSVRMVLSAALSQLGPEADDSAVIEPHDPSAHDLLSTEDLAHHLPSHHDVTVVAVMDAMSPQRAREVLDRLGIDLPEDPSLEPLIAWHETSHQLPELGGGAS